MGYSVLAPYFKLYDKLFADRLNECGCQQQPINKYHNNMIKKLRKRASASLSALLWLMLLALFPAQLSARDFQ